MVIGLICRVHRRSASGWDRGFKVYVLATRH
jgi:hypothetical protein